MTCEDSLALNGIKILDLSRVRAGPTCVRMFADFGADVIRIEPPPETDPNDAMFAEDRLGGDFQNLNRNKRSVTLNLKKPEGLEIFKRMARTADIVVENWRPKVKARLGIDYAELKKINPRIILASISGYGQDGPYVDRPAFDQVIQGMGGLMSVTGLPGQGPVRAGLAVSDSSTGLYAAIGVLIALRERDGSGEGQWVQASLLHSQIAMMDFQMARYLNEGNEPKQEGNFHPTSTPMGLFSGSDGVFNMGVAGDGMWAAFCEALECPHWLADEAYASASLRTKNRERLHAEIQDVFREKSVSHWVDLLNGAGIPSGPVYSVSEVFEDPQVQHLGVKRDVQVSNGQVRQVVAQPVVLERTPAKTTRGAPGLGEHTSQVLEDLGYSQTAIERLRENHVV